LSPVRSVSTLSWLRKLSKIGAAGGLCHTLDIRTSPCYLTLLDHYTEHFGSARFCRGRNSSGNIFVADDAI